MGAVRVVVIGAAAHVFALHRRGLAAIGAEVVGVQDVDAAGARQVAGELGCPAFEDVSRLLELPADLAVIVTPHPFHAEYALASLRAGLDVLVEKPMAVHAAEAQAMVDEAERCGRLLCVAFQQRTRPEVQAARRLIQEGFLGEIQRADLLATWPRRSAYFRSAPWRGSWRGEGGGALINQGQHDLDLLVYLVGRPSRIVGWCRTRLHPIETEDSVVALVEWPNGALGSLHLSTAEVDEAQRLEITGTRGRVRLLPGRLERFRNEVDFREHAASPGNPYAPPSVEALPPLVGSPASHEGLYRDLERALAGSSPPVAPGSEAMFTLELANAIIYSSLAGAEVTLPLDPAAYAERLDSLRRRSGADG
jgi:predicted dehydrogenase